MGQGSQLLLTILLGHVCLIDAKVYMKTILYDRYGENSFTFYEDGWAVITCSGTVDCLTVQLEDATHDTSGFAHLAVECPPGANSVYIKVPIDGNFPYDRVFKCRYQMWNRTIDQDVSGYFRITHRTCAKDCRCANGTSTAKCFCNAGLPRIGYKTYQRKCDYPQLLNGNFCPLRIQSQCLAMVSHLSSLWALYSNGPPVIDSTWTGELVPNETACGTAHQLSYKEVPTFYDEQKQFDLSTPEILIEGMAELKNLQCVAKLPGGTILQQTTNSEYVWRSPMHGYRLKPFPDQPLGIATIKVVCDAVSNTKRASFSVEFFVFDNTLEVQRLSTIARYTLSCNFTQNISDEFRVSRLWWTDEQDKVVSAKSLFAPTATGLYQCQAIVEARSCITERTFKQTFSSSPFYVNKASLSGYLSSGKFTIFGLEETMSYVVVASFTILGFCFLVAIGICFFTTRSSRSTKSGTSSVTDSDGQTMKTIAMRKMEERSLKLLQQRIRTSSMRNSQKQRILASGRCQTSNRRLREMCWDPSALSPSELKQKLQRMLAMTEEQRRGYVAELDAQSRQFEEHLGEYPNSTYLFMPKNCRQRQIPVHMGTQLLLQGRVVDDKARTLHMNKLLDFYNNAVLIGQAPVREQMVDHWSAIWQEKIGVVVWVGNIDTPDGNRIEPYIDLTLKKPVNYGIYTAKTELINNSPEFVTYYVKASSEGGGNIQIIFVHVHSWTADAASADLEKLAKAVGHIRKCHDEQTSKQLPGLMIHCDAGIHAGPALLTTLLCVQMYEWSRKVNVVAAMLYVRRHRYRAWTSKVAGAYDQILLIFSVIDRIISDDEANRSIKSSDKKRPPSTSNK